MQIFIVVFSLIFSLTALGDSTKRKVAVIYSYPKGEWYEGIQRGLKEILTSFEKNHYEVHDFLYDYEVFKLKPQNVQKAEVAKIVKLVSDLRADYIIINDDEAVEKFINQFPANKPLILNAINQEPLQSSWSKGHDMQKFCGVIEHYPIEESMKMISLMVKDLKQMSVISSEGHSSQIVSKIFRNMQKTSNSAVRIREIYLKSAWSDWKKAFFEINKKDQLAWILVPYEVVDQKGNSVSLTEMATWIKANVKVPLLGILSIHTKMGFLAAISVDPYGLGKQAAEIIIQLEKGSKCSGIGFVRSKYHIFEVNTDEVERLGMKVPEQFIGVAKFIKSTDPKTLKR